MDKKGNVTTDEYFIFSEGIKSKFPGYEVDDTALIKNSGDTEVELGKLISYFKSRNKEDIE